MDKASVYGTGDCRFESYQDQFCVPLLPGILERFRINTQILGVSEKTIALLAQWLERAAVNRKVTGSIPVGSGFATTVSNYYARAEKKKTRAHPGSNQGPADLQSAALPLSYTPTQTDERYVVYNQNVGSYSSVGQSVRLITVRSAVQARVGAILFFPTRTPGQKFNENSDFKT